MKTAEVVQTKKESGLRKRVIQRSIVLYKKTSKRNKIILATIIGIILLVILRQVFFITVTTPVYD